MLDFRTAIIEPVLTVDRVFPIMFNESKHKQEAVPREHHARLAHLPRLLHPQLVATHQLQLPVMKATNRSICLKQPRRPAELAVELEALVEHVLEEQVVLTLPA